MAEQRTDSQALFVIDLCDRPGVLAKIANVFYRRGLNICALTVGPTAEPARSTMLVTVNGPAAVLERVAAAMDNLVDVLSVERT